MGAILGKLAIGWEAYLLMVAEERLKKEITLWGSSGLRSVQASHSNSLIELNEVSEC